MLSPALSTWLNALLEGDYVVEPLAGDASTNTFYRITRGTDSSVLLVCAEKERLASHIHMHLLFRSLGLPVAGIISSCESLGVLLMEDLGDQHLCDAQASEYPAIYHQATTLINRLQVGAGGYRRIIQTTAGPYEPPILGRDRLLWELDFFATHYLSGFLRLEEEALVAIRRDFNRLLDAISFEPLVYCHRDYHSRNIMVNGGDISLVDLQDARWGHPLYDLVSLLCDSYVLLDSNLVSSCKRAFYESTRHLWASAYDFDKQFDFVAVQRSIKAIGTFASQARIRGKTDYLKFIPRAKGHVLARISQPETAALKASLDGAGVFSDSDKLPHGARTL